jgi:hypothetical protein
MKPVLRVLWLLLGLIYRLIVLVMFERWIPFPERPPVGQPSPDAPPAQRRARGAARGQVAVPRARQRQPTRGLPGLPGGRALPRPPIFEPRSVEPAPAYVAAMESQQLAPRAVRPLSTPQARAASGRPLRALLRDRRALAGAIVLGEAFAGRRTTRW